jgi:hypothetical protein
MTKKETTLIIVGFLVGMIFGAYLMALLTKPPELPEPTPAIEAQNEAFYRGHTGRF